jgi:hypothetical protein
MAKASGKITTAWISYSQAKELASEYLGDPEFVECALRKGLVAGEIPWRCARFDAPTHYSGPGPGDPKFFEEDLNTNEFGNPRLLVRFQGDSAKRSDGALALGLELDRNALVRLKLLPPDGDGDDTNAKVWVRRVAEDLKRFGKLDAITKKTEFARRIKGAAPPGVKASVEYIRDNVEEWGLWPTSKIKL